MSSILEYGKTCQPDGDHAQPVFMKKICKGEVVELPTNVPTNDDCKLYQQYKGAFHPLDSLVKCPLNQTVNTSGFEFFGEEKGSYNVSY
eukprot:3361628-Ditylum_brightwellii.AAC.1